MKSRIKNNILYKSILEIFKVSKKTFCGLYVLSAIQGVLNSVPIICLQMLFDELVTISSGEYEINAIIFWITMMFLTKCLLQIVVSIGDYIYEYHELSCMCELTFKLNQKVQDFGEKFERKETLDLIEKAYRGANQVRKLPDTVLTILLCYVPSFCVLGFYLYQASSILIVLLIFIFIPAVISHVAKEKAHTKLEYDMAPMQRKIKIFTAYLVDKEYYKETRIQGTFRYFQVKLEALYKQYKEMGWDVVKKSDLREFSFRLITLLGYLLILVILYVVVMQEKITIGYFVAIFAYLDKLYEMMAEVVYGILGKTVELFEQIRNYFRVQEMDDVESGKCEIIDNFSIKLKDVSFRYPNAEEDALKDINLIIQPNEKIAIVGENGSGKSTLIKVLIGLYTPTLGIVKYNDKNITEYKKGEIPKQISAVFQKFVRYKMTLEGNIRISDVGRDALAESVFKQLPLHMSDEVFNNGMETMLSKEFGGVELSGGQWQQIAIARGYFKRHKMILLDEPTSAIDPFKENEMYECFRKIAGKDCTTMIITHRMGAARYADRILVMCNGYLVAQGTHEELLQSCIEYQRLWNAQSEQYR